MAISYLVLFDADRIKEYVFATGRLKEIRGASEQVRRLTDYDDRYQDAPTFKRHELTRWERGADEGVIYASGGAGAVLFASQERAAAFCAELERDFRWQTVGATLSAVWEPVLYDAFERPEQAEADAQKRAAQKLARRKASRPQAELIPGGGAIRFCASDRLRPASAHIREVEGESLFASEATANKRFNNQRYRSRGAMMKGLFWDAFERALRACQAKHPELQINLDEWRDAIHPDQDLGNLSASARPSGYVALVYVDGDRVGQALRAVVTQEGFHGYQRFSQALTYAATHATAEALAAAYSAHSPTLKDDPDQPGRKRRFLPFEVITIGGDDVILICTGEHGLAVAQHICERFGPLLADAMAEYEPAPSLTASAGVVIAHDSLPIVQLERRGRELLKSAKKVEGGGIDFHIISTPALAEIKTVRDQDYCVDSTGLTSRPYARATLKQLLLEARLLSNLDFPGSKRADLYRACHAERVQATLDVLTVQMRMQKTEREALMHALMNLGYGLTYPFRLDSDRHLPYHTALIDLLEVMEFVAEEGQWGQSSAQK